MDVSALDGFENDLRQCLQHTLRVYKQALAENSAEISLAGDAVDVETFDQFEKFIDEIALKTQAYKTLARKDIPLDESVQTERNNIFKELIKNNRQKVGPTTQTLMECVQLKAQGKQINFSSHANEASEDLIVEEAIDTYICPITTTRLVKPLRSKVCNHHYSEDAIKQIFQSRQGFSRKASIKCPAFGCGSKITKNDLVADLDLERFLALNKP